MSRRLAQVDDQQAALPSGGKQRIDKWLWFARVVKTRSLAAKLVSDGHVRINSNRIDAPSKSVATGDVLTIALERQVRVLKVLSAGSRRGPFEEARLLYEDLTPSEPKTEPVAERDRGAGRPSRKDRQEMAKRFGDD